jgi:hypothetical protein
MFPMALPAGSTAVKMGPCPTSGAVPIADFPLKNCTEPVAGGCAETVAVNNPPLVVSDVTVAAFATFTAAGAELIAW